MLNNNLCCSKVEKEEGDFIVNHNLNFKTLLVEESSTGEVSKGDYVRVLTTAGREDFVDNKEYVIINIKDIIYIN